MGCLLARKIKKLVWYVTTGSTYTPQPPARAVSPSLAERWRLGCVPPSLEERRGARPWEVAPLNAGLFPSFLGKRDLSYPTRVGRQSEFPASRAPARQPILTEIPKKCKKKKSQISCGTDCLSNLYRPGATGTHARWHLEEAPLASRLRAARLGGDSA